MSLGEIIYFNYGNYQAKYNFVLHFWQVKHLELTLLRDRMVSYLLTTLKFNDFYS